MINSLLQRISVRHLRRAVAIRERMEVLEKKFADLVTGSFGRVADGPRNGRRRKRRMSSAGRARIAAAARARWAKVKAAGGNSLGSVLRKKRRLSAAARARIGAAARARWANVKRIK